MSLASTTTLPYSFKSLDLSDSGLIEICDLVNRASGNDALSPTYLSWQYRANPAGSAIGFNAYLGGELVSHYATIPVAAIIHGSHAKGLLSLNTATDPMHAGKGLFTKLANMTYEAGQAGGFQYVIGVANDNSVFGFTRKLGFASLGTLETRFVLGAPVGRSGREDPCFQTRWDGPALRWRLSNPKAHYYSASRERSALIYGSSTRFQVLLHQTSNAEPLALQPAPLRFRLNPVKLWLGLDTEIDWHRTPNVLIPARLRSTSLNLIFKDLQDLGSLDREQLRFWAIDFDSY